jgi:hypothetical protein
MLLESKSTSGCGITDKVTTASYVAYITDITIVDLDINSVTVNTGSGQYEYSLDDPYRPFNHLISLIMYLQE